MGLLHSHRDDNALRIFCAPVRNLTVRAALTAGKVLSHQFAAA